VSDTAYPRGVEHRVAYRIYYEDTDALGVVYYANYFKYFERGRTESIEAAGRGIAEWNRHGYLFVVHSVQATFKRPAVLGDRIEVVTSFSAVSPYRGRFLQRVERDGEVLVEGTVDCVCLDDNQQLREFPPRVLG